MKVLMICGAYTPDKCGVGDHAKIIYETFLNLDNSNDYYLLNSANLLKNNVSIDTFKLEWSIFENKKILKKIRNINPDIIHVQFPAKRYNYSFGILFLIKKLKKLGFKIIVTLHEYSYSPYLAKLRTNVIIKNIDLLLVVDEKYGVDLVSKKNISSDRVFRLPISSSMPKNNLLASEKHDFKKKIINNGLVLGYFGFAIANKKLETILEVGKKLKQLNINFIIIFICELNDTNSYQKSILNLIKESDLEENVIITGYLDALEVSFYLSICDFVIYPFEDSISTKSSSVLAAMLQGVKVITTTNDAPLNFAPWNKAYNVKNYTCINDILQIILDNKDNDTKIDYNIITWDQVANIQLDLYKRLLDDE